LDGLSLPLYRGAGALRERKAEILGADRDLARAGPSSKGAFRGLPRADSGEPRNAEASSDLAPHGVAFDDQENTRIVIFRDELHRDLKVAQVTEER
jgi:hypothetical protein